MAYTAITTNEIVTGQPTANNTFSKIKENFDDHESRLQTIEGGGNTTYPPIILRVGGYYDFLGATNNVLKTVTNFNLTITGVRLYIDTAGTSGTTAIDIKVSSAGGAYTTIFTTSPSVAYSAGNDAVSSNAILDIDAVDLLAGDLIRLDTTSVQTNGRNFYVRIDYIKT